MDIKMQVEDGASPFIEWALANKPKWYGSALKSTGFWAKQQIEQGIRSGTPGGKPYVQGMSARKRREIDDVMKGFDYNNPFKNTKRQPLRNYRPLGHLVKAVKYDKTRVDQGVVKVGWTSRSAVRIGTFQEKGVFQTVTDKMRRMFFAAGIGLKKGTNTIVLPVRQTYGAIKAEIDQGAPKYMEQKLVSYLTGNTARSAAKNRRRYRVYG